MFSLSRFVGWKGVNAFTLIVT